MEQANALQPDLILLGGDYVCADVESIRDLAPMLGRLNARYGVFAVQGNYDCLLGPDLIRSELAAHRSRYWLTAACTWDRVPDDSSWPGWIRFGKARLTRSAPLPVTGTATWLSRLCMNPTISRLWFG